MYTHRLPSSSSLSFILKILQGNPPKRNCSGASGYAEVEELVASKLVGGSEKRVPEYSTPNRRVLIIRAPKEGTLIFGNSHLVRIIFRSAAASPKLSPKNPNIHNPESPSCDSDDAKHGLGLRL